MNKYIIGAAMGAVCMFAGSALAAGPVPGMDEIYTLYLTKIPMNKMTTTTNVFRKVVDHQSGNVCYLYGTQGISCLPK